MSLITRCPACGTMFKIVPDQLRISEGWVRCGHCSEVFDASSNMQDAAPVPIERASEPQTHDALADEPVQARAEEEAVHNAHAEGFDSSLHTEIDEDPPHSQGPDSAMLEAHAQDLVESPLDQPFALRRPDVSQSGPQEEEAPPTASSKAGWAPAPSNNGWGPSPVAWPSRAPAPASQGEPEPELHELSFVRQARAKEFWRHPATRVFLFLLLLVLAALLAAQVGIHDRDRLAAAEPSLRPLLAHLCDALGCRIGPARQIDALAIESSSFAKLRGDAYRLNFTLRNQAPIQVAMPALELTLTDAQEQPVLRRVLLATDYAPSLAVIAPNADWSGSLAIGVAGGNGAPRISGYRVLAFYP
jgi:predicted Zn finger-like uncharacterized protein